MFGNGEKLAGRKYRRDEERKDRRREEWSLMKGTHRRTKERRAKKVKKKRTSWSFARLFVPILLSKSGMFGK